MVEYEKSHILTIVAKRAISSDVDIVFLTVFHELWLLKERMSLDLIGDL